MLTVEKFSRVIKEGSSSPALVTASDGRPYVVKFVGSGSGPTGLLSEYLVNRLAEAWNFPVPAASIVEIIKDRPPGVGTDEFWDLIERSVGPNLALEYIADAQPVTDLSRLKGDPRAMAQLHFMDCIFANYDRTPKNPNLLVTKGKTFLFIDHDSCRFLFNPLVTLPPDHLLDGERLDLSPVAKVAEPPFELCDRICREIPFLWRVTRVNPVQLHGVLRSRMKAYRQRFLGEA